MAAIDGWIYTLLKRRLSDDDICKYNAEQLKHAIIESCKCPRDEIMSACKAIDKFVYEHICEVIRKNNNNGGVLNNLFMLKRFTTDSSYAYDLGFSAGMSNDNINPYHEIPHCYGQSISWKIGHEQAIEKLGKILSK